VVSTERQAKINDVGGLAIILTPVRWGVPSRSLVAAGEIAEVVHDSGTPKRYVRQTYFSGTEDFSTCPARYDVMECARCQRVREKNPGMSCRLRHCLKICWIYYADQAHVSWPP
jgi:hypothetical protein